MKPGKCWLKLRWNHIDQKWPLNPPTSEKIYYMFLFCTGFILPSIIIFLFYFVLGCRMKKHHDIRTMVDTQQTSKVNMYNFYRKIGKLKILIPNFLSLSRSSSDIFDIIWPYDAYSNQESISKWIAPYSKMGRCVYQRSNTYVVLSVTNAQSSYGFSRY